MGILSQYCNRADGHNAADVCKRSGDSIVNSKNSLTAKAQNNLNHNINFVQKEGQKFISNPGAYIVGAAGNLYNTGKGVLASVGIHI